MTPTQHFAAQLRRYREQRGWTQPELARRCKAAGLDWDRSIVANVEGGRRASVAVHEVLALSYVLSVPAAMLIFPVGEADTVEIVPGVSLHPDLAIQIFLGEEVPLDSNRTVVGDQDDLSTFNMASLPIQLYRELRGAQTERDNASTDVANAEFTYGSSSEQAASARKAYLKALDAYAHALYRMVLVGVRTPAVSQSIIDELVRHGLHVRQRGGRDERDLTKFLRPITQDS